jgi:UPF0716 family protein affecting phage T7 exclusion
VDHRPRNPLRSEADMFRVLMMFVIAGAAVVAVALLVNSLAGFLLGVVLLAIGIWRAWGLFQEWRRYGSDPAER